ncbi:asparagine synthase-related protein [Lentzea sp. BCCO 10_0798]|uniref:asparagine synthase (glutamine-hydrolyzing) n=1 Tax=Lentzea kristufekii TaxID=3095430 RepID=A0ABU4TYT7_9PSEU|nr:asparagine synthase-related protein [Lentzea sp. BCCO 10_0798]MDX8053481.1 asparagine synthase-related protein [Lentzea sp. BCCO 10_0798]
MDAAWLRLSHGQSGPADQVRRVDAPNCQLTVLGFSGVTNAELASVARRVGRGELDALSCIGGSCVVIAVGPDDAFVTGDLAGQRVVFYTHTADHGLLLGSQSSQLAELTGRVVAADWLATYLTVPQASDLWWTGSPWRDVHALRPGWVLRLPRSGEVESWPLIELDEPQSDLSAAGAGLALALRHAVRGRVSAAAHATADLSGGLDSSTLAVLAAGATSREFSAITLEAADVEDSALATSVAEALPGLHHRWSIPDGVLPYSNLESVLVPDEPTAFAANAARSAWWLRKIAALKSDVHLSGDGGDAVLMALPSYLGDFGPGSVRQLWSHALGWAKLRNLPPHALVRAGLALRGTSYSDALRTLAVQMVTDEAAPRGWTTLVSWLGYSKVTEWLTPEARALVASRLHAHAASAHSPLVPGRFGIGDSTSWLSLIGFGRGQRLYAETAARLGVNHHAPYLDDEVILACWSVAARVRTTPEQVKPLLLEAFTGVVPASLVRRTTKGDYSGLAYQGLKRNAGFLHDLFTNSRLASCGLIDEQAVRWTIETAAVGIPIPLGAFDELVSTELWLRAQKDGSASRSRPKGEHHASTR